MDFINQWRALSVGCKDQLSEVSAVEMCTQGMHCGLLYNLQGIKTRTFEELATRAHEMEISMDNHGGKNHPLMEQRKDVKEVKNSDKSGKILQKGL